MLQWVADDDVDAVIVYRRGRFSREPLHIYQLVQSLRQAEVEQLHDAVMLLPFDLKPPVRCDSIMAEGVNVADDLPDEIQRWTAKRRAVLILASLREGETSAHGRCSGLARGQTRSRWGKKQYDSAIVMARRTADRKARRGML